MTQPGPGEPLVIRVPSASAGAEAPVYSGPIPGDPVFTGADEEETDDGVD